MSNSIYWRQAKPTDCKHFPCETPSAFIVSIERAFGDLPRTFDCESIPTLAGMSATQPDTKNIYRRMIEAIDKYGAIEVWAQG